MEISAEIVKDLIAALDRSRLSTLRLETEGFKLVLERGEAGGAAPAPRQDGAAEAAPAEEPVCGSVVTSPIVGTFYAAASPEKPPFAKIGQTVKKGETLFIVESMKLMNEVNSEYDGTVAEIYVKNGQGVEYGQPIMRIE